MDALLFRLTEIKLNELLLNSAGVSKGTHGMDIIIIFWSNYQVCICIYTHKIQILRENSLESKLHQFECQILQL